MDSYQVLGVSPYASQREIKRVYHKKVLIYHPDKKYLRNWLLLIKN